MADMAVSSESEAEENYAWAPKKARSLAVRERQTLLAAVDVAILLRAIRVPLLHAMGSL
jgi:hypothetical protein